MRHNTHNTMKELAKHKAFVHNKRGRVHLEGFDDELDCVRHYHEANMAVY